MAKEKNISDPDISEQEKNTETQGATTNTEASAPAETPKETSETPDAPSNEPPEDSVDETSADETPKETPKTRRKPVKPLSKPEIKSVKEELAIMDRLKIDVMYKNSKGEYFTQEGLAVYSEGGKKDNVSVVRKADLETIIKSLSDAD